MLRYYNSYSAYGAQGGGGRRAHFHAYKLASYPELKCALENFLPL